ncbi:LPXTG cell wall anchor domain-containing protein [Nosocomiicoccus ampullae]|uniref:LPXTG-motif cell wall-anchored protein n=1 Tax=Nosocomiicoccus ampullae TaxID=489910 RepID=A0A9Q2HFW0_9STAP|nr:LPXTG cell wall anchor domain-containing protein [Nosocomiicoccus ampullae]MBB5176649.1 LPXTG-motif cell wall-anchored protein [Nosocomiicoccus ampullae]QYA46585.1 LPXTG cell wall anchor domain-containing protein [Nosocomiicoccus ampullae]
MRALKLLSTIFLLNIIISVQPVHAEEDAVETSPKIETNAVDEGAGENVSGEESNDQEEGQNENQENGTTETPTENTPEAPKENNDNNGNVDTPPQGSGSGELNSPNEIDKQLKESDEQVLDAVRVEEKPSDYNNYDTNVNTQQEFDNNSSEVVEDNTVVSKEDHSKGKTNNNKKDSKKKTPHGAKELPNTGIHENIELIYVLEIVLLTSGLLLLFRKSSKVKIRK